jgi:hypothetical protein
MIVLLAAGMLSVLELHNKLPPADRAAVDTAYLADRVRAEVLDAHLDVKVMTRENMLTLLEAQGKKLEDCEGECEVETGRRLGSDYVVSGEVLRVGSQLKLSLKLHETKGGTLLGAVSASGVDIESLDAALPASVKRLTAAMQPQPGPPPAAAAPRPVPADAVSMKVSAPPDGNWLLVDSDGSLVCSLPCASKLARDRAYFAERDAALTADRTRVALPSTSAFAPGRSAEATYVPSRGSKTLGMVAMVGGLTLGAIGVGLVAAKYTQYCLNGVCDDSIPPAGSTGSQVLPNQTLATGMVVGGGALAVVGLILLIISHDEHYEAALR